jgi:hypothetical protein
MSVHNIIMTMMIHQAMQNNCLETNNTQQTCCTLHTNSLETDTVSSFTSDLCKLTTNSTDNKYNTADGCLLTLVQFNSQKQKYKPR